jgi:hypothetical protein
VTEASSSSEVADAAKMIDSHDFKGASGDVCEDQRQREPFPPSSFATVEFPAPGQTVGEVV